MSKTFFITGGGTGGHVFPGISIAKALQQKGHTVIYIGSAEGFEAKIVPQSGIPLECLKSGAIKNQSLLKILKSLLTILFSLRDGLGLIRKYRPVAVIGVGGYVSIPMGLAAFLSRVPLYLQEQNVSVGLANRLLGRLAQKVFLGFEAAQVYFPKKNTVVTGNPLRPELFQVKSLPSTYPENLNLLVFGGSQGAMAINTAFLKALPYLLKQVRTRLTILHQTGVKDQDRIESLYKSQFPSLVVRVVPFINDMRSAYEEAHLVICRSGALTVSELLVVKRPSLLVPFPRKGQNDQVDNALYLEKIGVAQCVQQGDGFEERFQRAILQSIDVRLYLNKVERLAQLPSENGTDRMVDWLLDKAN